MPRLRRGVELSEYELAWLARALTLEQKDALLDAGWDDVGAMVDFAVPRSPGLRAVLGSRRERVPRGIEPGWEQFLSLRFWDEAVPLLVANPPAPGPPPFVESAGEQRPAGETRGAKELGIPERETFWIIERRLENPQVHSRKWLAQETKRRDDLEYVPRDRLSPLVDWIDLHPAAAGQAARVRVIPSEFRAGKLGPIPPTG